ncbi:MAG TPA: DUF2911 domain-containing protein [Flavisolibacter sp.]|jgi:hypothetical protein|nr:DUF2911 domain-containing protein [Flavisolibacter sp.]
MVMLLVTSLSAQAQKEELCYNTSLVKDTTQKNSKSMAAGTVGGNTVTIKYRSPGVRKRIIWGGLVLYGEVGVTGAHDATLIEIKKPFIVAGKIIPSGKCAFFSIPGQDEWTLIINKHWQQHLASEYDIKEDVVRLKVKPVNVPHTGRLQ